MTMSVSSAVETRHVQRPVVLSLSVRPADAMALLVGYAHGLGPPPQRQSTQDDVVRTDLADMSDMPWVPWVAVAPAACEHVVPDLEVATCGQVDHWRRRWLRLVRKQATRHGGLELGL
jgi:hypothetical protein